MIELTSVFDGSTVHINPATVNSVQATTMRRYVGIYDDPVTMKNLAPETIQAQIEAAEQPCTLVLFETTWVCVKENCETVLNKIKGASHVN